MKNAEWKEHYQWEVAMEMDAEVKIIVNNDRIIRRFRAVLDLEKIDRDNMPLQLTGRILDCGLVDEHELHATGTKHLWIVGPGEMTWYSVVFDRESFAFLATRL